MTTTNNPGWSGSESKFALAMGAAKQIREGLATRGGAANSIQRAQLADNIDHWVGQWSDEETPRMTWPDAIVDASGMQDRRRALPGRRP